MALQKILAGKPDDRPRRAAYESALGLFEKAMAILPAFAPDAPAADPVRRAWQEFYTGKMSVLLFLGRCTEALQAMDGSIAVSGGPDNAFLVGMRKTLRMAAEMEQSHMPWSRPTGADHAKAVRMADYLAAQEGVSDAAIFNAACALALASRDQECGAAERRARADRAMNYLLRIAGKGYFQKLRLFPLPPRNTIHELHTDDALDPLRDRPDFRALADRFRDGK